MYTRLGSCQCHGRTIVQFLSVAHMIVPPLVGIAWLHAPFLSYHALTASRMSWLGFARCMLVRLLGYRISYFQLSGATSFERKPEHPRHPSRV